MDIHTRRQLVLRAAARAEHVRVKCNISPTSSVDPISVAGQRGCEVLYMSLPSLEGVYSPTPRPAIILGSERPAGRRAYTCTHELGHHEFKHGVRLEELKKGKPQITKDPDEFLADMFAANLLMSQASIHHALKVRSLDITKMEPMQVLCLASFFGVGYSTLIDQMTFTLGLLNHESREHLKKVKPKDIKARFDCAASSELVMVDEFWQGRAVDIEVGDTLVLYPGAVMEDKACIMRHKVIDGRPTFKAVARGLLRAYRNSNDWAVNIRIAPKQYAGLAQYRFLNDPEEDLT